MRQITRAEWQRYCRHGYASLGEYQGSPRQRFVLALCPRTQATVLEPVEVIGAAPPGPAPVWAPTAFDEVHSTLAGRRAAEAYLAGSSLD